MSKNSYPLMLVLAVMLCLATSCVRAVRNNAFAEFLQNESLELMEFRIEPTPTGHHVRLVFLDPKDSNRKVEGALFLVDLEKQKEQSAYDEKILREKSDRHRTERLENTNLVHRLSGFGADAFKGSDGGLGFLHSARPLESERILARFPGFRIFSVSYSDPMMHPFYTSQPLVIPIRHQKDSESNLKVLLNAPTVAAFISNLKQPVPDITAARETLDVFCELQGWTLVKEMPEHIRAWSQAKNADWVSRWKYRETERPDGWRFQSVCLTDPFINSYWHVEIDVLHTGDIAIKSQVPMGSIGMYR